MVAILLGTMFAAITVFAVGVIAASLHRHVPAVRALRAEMANLHDMRQVRVRISEVRVTSTATVLRPDFTGWSARPSTDLPAAA